MQNQPSVICHFTVLIVIRNDIKIHSSNLETALQIILFS